MLLMRSKFSWSPICLNYICSSQRLQPENTTPPSRRWQHHLPLEEDDIASENELMKKLMQRPHRRKTDRRAGSSIQSDKTKHPLADNFTGITPPRFKTHHKHLLPVQSVTTLNSSMAIKTTGFLSGSLPEELMQILVTLASTWEDVNDPNEIQVKPLSGAMTNEVFQIIWAKGDPDPDRKVLVRIYGEGVDIFFNRDDEIRTFECLSHHGQGPRLLGRFPDGRVEEFLHGRTLSAEDLRDPEISTLIAAKMREFHSLDMPGTKTVPLWNRMRRWLRKAKGLCPPSEIKEFGLDSLDEEIQLLEKELMHDDQEIGFCHNDLQYGNIMMDDETKSITLIDYEYASYNPVAYDIANHFCEMAANYHSDTPHILDYSKYPDEEERRRFIHAYLSSSDDEPSEIEVEDLVEAAEKYTLANHIFWGLWGIISSHVNKIDFDYKEYAKQRFQQYRLRKRQLLGPSLAPVGDDDNGF